MRPQDLLSALVLIALLLIAGRSWTQYQEADARADALADSVAAAQERREAAERQLSAATARADSAEAARAEADARARAAQEEARRERERARAQVAEAGDHLHATLDTLEAVVAPEHAPLVQAARGQARGLQAAHEREVAALEVQVEALEVRLAGAERLLEHRDEQIAAWERSYQELSGQSVALAQLAEHFRERASPGFWERTRRYAGDALIWVGIGAGIGLGAGAAL